MLTSSVNSICKITFISRHEANSYNWFVCQYGPSVNSKRCYCSLYGCHHLVSFGLKYFIKKFTRNFFRFGTVVPGRSICTSCWKCWFSTVRNEELVAKMNLAICKSIACCFDEDLPMTLKVDCFSCLACGAFFFLRRCF